MHFNDVALLSILKQHTSTLFQISPLSPVLVRGTERTQFELFHEQLPLPVPCYDLLPITELAVGRIAANFGHSRLS